MDKEYLKKCNNKIKKLKKTNELEINDSVFYVKDFLLETFFCFFNFSIFFYWNSIFDIDSTIQLIEISNMSSGSFFISETYFIHSISLFWACTLLYNLFDLSYMSKKETYDTSDLTTNLILSIFVFLAFVFLFLFTYLTMTIIFALVYFVFYNFFSLTELSMVKNIILSFTSIPFFASIYFLIKSGLKVFNNRSIDPKKNKPKNDDVIKDIFSKISCNLKNIDDFIYFEYVVNEYKLKHLIPVLEPCKKNLLIKYKAKNIKELKERHFKDNHIKNENKVFHKTIKNN